MKLITVKPKITTAMSSEGNMMSPIPGIRSSIDKGMQKKKRLLSVSAPAKMITNKTNPAITTNGAHSVSKEADTVADKMVRRIQNAFFESGVTKKG